MNKIHKKVKRAKKSTKRFIKDPNTAGKNIYITTMITEVIEIIEVYTTIMPTIAKTISSQEERLTNIDISFSNTVQDLR